MKRALLVIRELHPEIEKQPYDLLIDKKLPGSFTNTALESWLRSHEIDTVVISGYMTQADILRIF